MSASSCLASKVSVLRVVLDASTLSSSLKPPAATIILVSGALQLL